MKIGNKIMVHAYKKNGWLYRTWEFPLVVDVNDDFICLLVRNSWVTTSEKHSNRNFHSTNHNDSLWFFFKKKWFNVIATINADKVSYYINIASPYIFEEDAIKYIDFDYDIKINQNGVFTVIDGEEFELHKEEFNYGRKLTKIIEMELEKLVKEEVLQKIKDQLSLEVLQKLLKKASSLQKRNIEARTR